MAKSLKEISDSVKSGTYKASPMAAAVANRKRAPEPIKIDTVDYDVPMSAIYDRMNDGSYMAKYENYLGAEGNEERLARQQSTGSKWSNGLLKNGAKTLVNFTDSLAGTIYGLGKYATTGDFSDMYDNELTSYFDDVNKGLDNRLANYYTQEEKSKNIIEKLGTANFWANDVAGGFAFVGGALLSEAAVGVLTGGASLGVGAAKFSAKLLGKTLAKEGIDKAGKKAIKGLMAAKYGKTGGDIAKTFAFTLRTSSFEAGMEARQNYKQAVDTYLDKFEELNGRKPTYDEQKVFFDNAKTASNLVYGSNLAILGVSNAVMFGKKLLPSSITKPVTNSLNRVVGLGTKTIVEDGVTKTVMRGANRAQKILGNTINIASKPLTEGLFEEGLQGVAGKTMQKYLDSKYNPNALEGYDAWSSFHDSMSEQYTSKEGWNEIGIGMIIGLAGGGLNPAAIKSGHALPGFFKNSWKNQYKSKEAGLDRANKGIEALASLNRVSAAKAMSKDGGDFNESIENYNFIRSQEHIKEKSDIIEDYETVINSIDFEENQELRSQLEDMGVSPETYKEDSINNFKEFYKNYDFARKSVEALGLNSALQDTPGNISEVADNLMIQIVTGKDAYNKAKNIGQDLSDTIGVSGMFDYHDFYNKLSAEDVAKADELKEQKTRLKSLQDEAISIGQELSVLSAQKKAAADPNALQGKFNEVSQKATLTQQEIQKTTGRVSELTSLLNKSLISSKFDITKLNSKDMNIDLDINSVIDNISMVDDYIDALEREGRAADAGVIRYKQRNLQANLIAHTEMVNSYRRMLDSNFFSSKEGKTLVSRLLGSKYEMSEDFRSLINENEEKLFNSLKLTGQIEFGELVDTKLTKVIQNNPDISDREKHRLESLIRLQLSANALRNITKDLGIASDEITTAEVNTNENSLTGDTVTIKSKIELTTTNLNNIQELDKAIKSITAELEYVVNQSQDNKDKVEAMTVELEDLLGRKAEIETSLGKAATTTDTEAEINTIKDEISKISDIYEKGLSADGKFKSDDLEVSISELPTAQGYKSSIIQKGEKFDQGDEFVTKEEAIEFTKNYITEFKNKLLSTYEAELDALSRSVQQNDPFSAPEQEELVNINGRIAELEAKIKEGNQEFKITESEDYLRFEELAAKLDRGETSPQEEAEMEGLRKSLDQWTFITGVVVKGFRLSDLIQQKSALESAVINVAESVEVPTVEDVMESVNLDDIKQRSNYNLAQSYDKVVVSKRNGNYVIHNMLDSDFEAMVEGLGVAPISDPTGKNNIILSEEDFQKLPVKLFNISTNKRNYSPALEVLPDKNGADALFVINSGQKIEEGHDVQALYESNADDPITLSVDVEYPYNKSIIERYRKAVKNLRGKTRFTKEEKQAMEDSLNEIRRDLNISVFRGDKKIATLKGSRRTTMNNTTDVVFENLRASISESMDFLDAIADPYQKGYVNVVVNNKQGDVVIPDITIQKIYLGFPNLNYQINEDGEAVVESRPVSDTEASKIIDLGYMRKGKTFTRDGETVDKTFMSSLEKRSEKKDVPFIVLNVGGKRVAYPVKVNVQRTIDTEEFESIYNNDSLTDSAKSIQLNKWMAAHGVDVKIPGNAFISFGDSNVNDDNFFQDKLAQIKRINYFYKVTDWINTKNTIEDIVKSQISVDINLENPFHSPKVQLNYDNLGLNVIVKNKPATNNAKSAKSNPKPSSIFNCK
jgi:hypothetical protein